MNQVRRLLCTALCAPALLLSLPVPAQTPAQGQPQPLVQNAALDPGAACPNPITGPALAQQFRMLSWKETDYVVQRDPGMKKAYAALPPNLKAQAQANPAAVPWDLIAAKRDQDTLDRVAALVHDARLASTIDSFAPLNWASLTRVLAQDAEFQVWVDNPKGTPLENAAANPHAFEWRNLLATRDTCQLTAMLEQSRTAAKSQPARR
jgi:hypothetical protein